MTNPMKVRVDTDLTCREWLVAHGYSDINRLIGEATEVMGKDIRRSWWPILAGTPTGEPRTVYGFTFPVLKAARRRQGYPPDVQGAYERSPHELAPAIKRQERWGKGFKRAMK